MHPLVSLHMDSQGNKANISLQWHLRESQRKQMTVYQLGQLQGDLMKGVCEIWHGSAGL